MIRDSTKLARDGFYVAVGFGVIGVQKLQVRRRELEAQWQPTDRVDAAHRAVSRGLHDLDDRLTTIEHQIDAALVGVEALLPPTTVEAVHQARDVARVARSQAIDLVAGPRVDPEPR